MEGIDPVNAVLMFWGFYLVGLIVAQHRRAQDDEA